MIDRKELSLESVPNKPGVYLWKNYHNEVIYVGKAKNLANRVRQYFSGKSHAYFTQSLINSIASLEYIITKDEKDALILETNLIKKYTPRYNILLIDDKNHVYIRLQPKEDDLIIEFVYRVKKDNATYFGPYPVQHGIKNVLNLLIRLTKFENGLPITLKNPNYWMEKFELCKQILSTQNTKMRSHLKELMSKAAREENFELANDYKKILDSLLFYSSHTSVQFDDKIDYDVWGITRHDNYYLIAIMFYRKGKLISVIHKIVENNFDDFLAGFITSFYQINLTPDRIIIDSKFIMPSQIPLNVLNPHKGKYKTILNVATQNAKDNQNNKIKKFQKENYITINILKKLSEILFITNLNHIMMIDNSMTANTDPVSVVVSYRNGKKNPSEYRKYNLKPNLDRLADVEYLRQSLNKFFIQHKNNLPNLLILDGGKPQIQELNKMVALKKIKLNYIGLVKDDKHQTRAIITPKLKEIPINDRFLLKFLSEMQIEVDRFAKKHHRHRRKISTLEGKLLTIPGIGKKREVMLLKHFHTYANIYNASIEELNLIVSLKIAKRIKNIL